MDSNEVVLGHVARVGGSTVTGALGRDVAATPRLGNMVKFRTPQTTVYGLIVDLATDRVDAPGTAPDARVDIELLGEVVHGGTATDAAFRSGVSVYPTLGEPILTVTAADLLQVYARPHEANVEIGSVFHDADLPAYAVTDTLLGKHFAVVGSTGSGKSCAVALLLHAILRDHPHGHIILLDPHNEYAHAFGERAEMIRPASLNVPYWLLNFAELTAAFVSDEAEDRQAETNVLRDAVQVCRRKQMGDDEDAHSVTVDSPVPFSLTELERVIRSRMGKLDRPERSPPYLRLLARLDELRSDKRFQFMFPGIILKDTIVEVLSRILRIPVAGRPITIIDLSGVPSEIVDVVVSLVCRMIFDFALWSAEEQAVPTLLVCEEAHRYVPGDAHAGFEPTRRAIARIAKEGRKYGVSLCLVSQRPSDLSGAILSQCNTIFALRMSNRADQDLVRAALPDAAFGLLDALSTLRPQEAIALGAGIPVPLRLRFADLDPADRPRSGTAAFSHAWQADTRDRAFIRDTVSRWRQQRRSPGPEVTNGSTGEPADGGDGRRRMAPLESF